ncbi:MAG: ABC transporter permease [Thiohalomonadales bacterium]
MASQSVMPANTRLHSRILLVLRQLLPIVVLLSIWEILTRSAIIDARFFPAPSTIIHYLLFTSPSEGILTDIGASLFRIFWGYLLGCSLGMAFGIAMGLSARLKGMLYPLVIVTYPIPKIAILPLIMLIFGLGDLSKIIVVMIGSFFLVLMNTLHGVEGMPRIFHDIASVYNINRWAFIKKIVFPAALPSIFTGLKLAIGYSLVIVVAAEFSGAQEGVGYLIWQSWETFSIKSMYAGLFVLGIMGLIFTFTLEWLEKKLIPWRQT